jgi:hypothetical protein
MVDEVPRRQGPLKLLTNRPQMIGLVVAGLVTAGILAATLTGALPLIVVAGGGFLAIALMVIRDLMDGDHASSRRRPTGVKIAQVKRHPSLLRAGPESGGNHAGLGVADMRN